MSILSNASVIFRHGHLMGRKQVTHDGSPEGYIDTFTGEYLMAENKTFHSEIYSQLAEMLTTKDVLKVSRMNGLRCIHLRCEFLGACTHVGD